MEILLTPCLYCPDNIADLLLHSLTVLSWVWLQNVFTNPKLDRLFTLINNLADTIIITPLPPLKTKHRTIRPILTPPPTCPNRSSSETNLFIITLQGSQTNLNSNKNEHNHKRLAAVADWQFFLLCPKKYL